MRLTATLRVSLRDDKIVAGCLCLPEHSSMVKKQNQQDTTKQKNPYEQYSKMKILLCDEVRTGCVQWMNKHA